MPTLETASVEGHKRYVSSKTFAREQQQEGNWCYAATERMIKLAYGKPVGQQADIARHYWTVIERPTGAEVEKWFREIKQLEIDEIADEEEERKKAAEESGSSSESTPTPVRALRPDREIMEDAVLRVAEKCVTENRGNPTFGFGQCATAALSDDSLKAIVQNDNLAVIGDKAHLRVLCGFEEDQGGAMTKLVVFDPLGGGTDLSTIDMSTYRGSSDWATFTFT